MPRLLTRMSSWGTARTSAAAPSAVAGSARTPRTSAPPAARISSTARSSLARLRPAITTAAPSTASLREISRPMPAVAPVTSAVLSLSCKSMAKTPYLHVTTNQFTRLRPVGRSFPDRGDAHLLQEREVVLDVPVVADMTIADLQQIGGNERHRLA